MAQFGTINVTVTTAGTRVQVTTTDLPVARIFLRGHAANTGHIYFGDVTVSSTVGLQLKVGDMPFELSTPTIEGESDPVNLKNFYVDSSVNGDKLSILYFY